MKKSFILSIYLLSFSLIFNCGSVRKKTGAEKLKKTGNIAGIVFDIQTMQPLAGAVVYINEIKTIGAKTDSLGRFWLSSVPEGEYTVWAQKIYYYTGEIRKVKVSNHSTSIVVHRLVYRTIPERPYWHDWDGRIIKTDSISFFNTQK